jgi:hypothetical protein
MPKAKTDSATVKRFERALRNALNTPPEAPRKKAKAKRKRRAR